MIKNIFKVIKRIIISILILYGYNLATQPFNLNIPINIYTVLIVSMFDGVGFFGLVAFYLLNFR